MQKDFFEDAYCLRAKQIGFSQKGLHFLVRKFRRRRHSATSAVTAPPIFGIF